MDEFFRDLYLWRCLGFLIGLILLWIATGVLKERQMLAEADSRKINHIAVFVGGTLLFAWLPVEHARVNFYVVCSAVFMMVLIICRFRHTVPFSYAYAANTRQSDAPHATFFFWFSWLASIIALMLLDLLFSQLSVTRISVLIVGIADGIAEPIGRRWGQHCYKVLSLRGTPSFRSIEGSMAVWFATLAVMLAFSTSTTNGMGIWITAAFLTASFVAVVEAISPRGLDNFMLLLTSATLLHIFFAARWIV